MVIKTTGLEYDDRLRKECVSLVGLNMTPAIAALEDRNRRGRGKTAEGITYRTIALLTRGLLPHRRGLFLKTMEMYARFTGQIIITRPRTLWVHNMEMAGLVVIGYVLKRLGICKRLIWDQHELPPEGVLSKSLYRAAFRTLISACDAVVAANPERREYLLTCLAMHLGKRIHVLQNLTDQTFSNLPAGVIPPEVAMWLDGVPYVLAQGGTNSDRHLEELVKAVTRFPNLKLVVVGPYEHKELEVLAGKVGAQFLEQQVYFTGMVPQMQLVNFIDNALASVVLYDRSTHNSWLCAPNRLYQAVCRGTPVVVGSNPPMASLVRSWGCGVVLSGDGSDVEDITDGIRKMLANHQAFRAEAQANRCNLTWETQASVVGQIAGREAG